MLRCGAIVCNSPAAWPPLDQDAPKGFTLGTHRLVPPGETLARLRRLAAPLGITRLANVTGLDRIGVPVAQAIRPNARSAAVSEGKGLDLVAAQVSAMAESIERYHAEHVLRPLKLAAYEELRYTHPLVDPSRLPRSAAEPFDPFQIVHWIEGYDLVGRRPVWLPFDLVHANFTVGLGDGAGFLRSTNGLASGNHPLEAVSHGLCELIERDAASIWSLKDDAARWATRLDTATVDDAACRGVLERYAATRVGVAVWEVTSEVGLAAFLCRIVDLDPDPERRQFGAEGLGCHPSRTVALLRALTEAAQSRLTVIVGASDEQLPADYEAVTDRAVVEGLRREVVDRPGRRAFGSAPDHNADSFGGDVAWELARLSAAGFDQAVVVDLSRPELGVPVVRVVVPGVEAWAAGAFLSSRAHERAGVPR
jgi:YcaO-like protein with predicted kinase domain